MANDQKWNNIGEQISKAVTDAISTGNFSQIGPLVNETVNEVIKEAKSQSVHFDAEAKKTKQHIQSQIDRQKQQFEEQRRRQEEQRRQWNQQQETARQQEALRQQEEIKRQQEQLERQKDLIKRQQETIQRQQRIKRTDNLPPIKFNKVGKVSGVLSVVFGGIGLGLSSLGAIALFILFLANVVSSGWLIVIAAVILSFACLIRVGIAKQDRVKRAERYAKLCGTKLYGVLEDLAKQTGKSLRFVKKDIKKMIEMGIYPEGHLDEKQTCLMLTDVIYHQYEQTQEAYEQRAELEDKKQEEKSLSQQVQEARDAQDSELNAMIAEGMECIRKLRDLNDRIADEKITQQLFTLERLLNEIFDRVKEHPEQMDRMHKLMNYYLPTTVKLVEAYEEFDQVSVQGEEIKNAKAEIEKTLGIINDAFVELLNNLFQDSVLDVTTDAQVLQTMLAREGLTKEPAFVTRDEK